MDTSEEYILMCQKAIEIQKKYKPKSGDFQANRINFRVTVFSGKYSFNKKKVWLPRQDQSQEMVDGNFKEKLNKIYKFSNSEYPIKPYVTLFHFINMEQLWLAFVMSEKYNKIFDGKDWVKK